MTPTDTTKAHITNTGYLGLLPFFIGALGPWLLIAYESVLIELFIAYSIMILGFMSGCVWALGAFGSLEHPIRLLYAGLLPIGLIVVALVVPPVWSIGLLALGYALLLLSERAFLSQYYPAWYQQLRRRLTWTVLSCHLLCFFNIIHTPIT